MKELIGCRTLDDLLGGGFEKGALSLIYGEAGTGKTNICIQIARNVALSGRKVLYIDTEGVSMDRLRQIAGERLEDVKRNILFFTPYSFEEQESKVDEVIKLIESSKGKGTVIGLVIVDSATVYYRLKLHAGETQQGPHSSLNYQVVRLLTAARKHDIAIVVTSQVYLDIDQDVIRPLGGNVLAHNSKSIIHLERVDTRKRKATVMKHRAICEGRSAQFLLTERGVEPWPPVELENGVGKGAHSSEDGKKKDGGDPDILSDDDDDLVPK